MFFKITRIQMMIVFAALALGVLNHGIYQNEWIKKNGEVVLLELAPVDPRSLMQGDYMILRYAIEESEDLEQLAEDKIRGHLVVKVDENNVGQFERLYDESQPLAADERRFEFKKHYYQIEIVPDSFMFQEGHAKYYDKAKYGVFKFNGPDQYLLTDLADEHQQIITVKDETL